ncbi:MAG: hypothetical protein FD163_989 [Hyphomonadaceae bacterium]|nr:MAG: hypothetical protein FD128_965 [Hyphomonadaceae bacterium]KAF0186321.1 MAG: hypothetical protein FD163_989 [Hyphomonadaceae bacterium]
MSVDSELIIFKEKIPDVSEIVSFAAKEGVTLRFPAGFDFKIPTNNYVDYEIDGEKVMFGLALFPITDLDFVSSEERMEPLPKKARKYGDTIMSFQTKGTLSGQALHFIQKIFANNFKAAGVFDEEFVTPSDLGKEYVPPADMMPELAATFVGTPKERAIALDKYIVKVQSQIPPIAAEASALRPKIDPLNWVINWLSEHKYEYVTFLIALAALFIWGFLNAKN